MDFDPDTTSRRTYEFTSGAKLHAQRMNPYGFIKIHHDKGLVPSSLSGEYTSYDEADKAIQLYISAKNKELVGVTNLTTPNEIK